MNWDKYFLGVAKAVAVNSKCLSRQIGAVLVRDKSIVSTGYNGPARGVPPCYMRVDLINQMDVDKTYIPEICPRKQLGFKSSQGLHLCVAAHAEVNAISNAARNGVSTIGCSLYLSCALLPCKDCLTQIINAGIVEVVVVELNRYDETSQWIYDNARTLKIRTYDCK